MLPEMLLVAAFEPGQHEIRGRWQGPQHVELAERADQVCPLARDLPYRGVEIAGMVE